MIGGGARISEDVAPYCLAAVRNMVVGLNVVGLRRRGIKLEALRDIKRAYRLVQGSSGNLRSAASASLARRDFASEEGRRFLEFFQGGSRRFARARYATAAEAETPFGDPLRERG
jgi:UDP-N-acetylglucosamine acyltransferase